MVERIPSPGVSAPLPAQPARGIERTGDPRLEALQRSLTTMIGNKVPVAVLARSVDGSFLVRVADTPVRMQLPPGTQPGTELFMTVLATSPRPSFQLNGAIVHGSFAPLASTAPSFAAAASLALTDSGDRHQAAALSPVARLLAQVLHSAAGSDTSAVVSGAAPLLSHGAPDPARLAGTLQQAIAKSGLFYESHVADWAEGKRALAELMLEPQAQKAPGTPPADPALARMINMQLASQEQGQILWQGQLAPGQPFEWTVTREQEERSRSAPETESAWQSGLRLRFAALGEVEARVTLRGSELRIELKVAPAVRATLRAGAPQLEDALAAAGSELAALRIHAAETP